MANIILIKRGYVTEINSASLQEGEFALAFGADMKTVEGYIGNGTGTPILLNGGKIAEALAEAKQYVDGKITDLIGGAPAAYDTLKEIADYIATHEDAYQALMDVAGNKLDKPTTDGTTGQVLKIGADGKPSWEDETDTTYANATQQAAGLMSAEDKVKLDGVTEGAEPNVQSDWNQTDESADDFIKNKPTIDGSLSDTSENAVQNKVIKKALDGKMDATGTIDCGTFGSYISAE